MPRAARSLVAAGAWLIVSAVRVNPCLRGIVDHVEADLVTLYGEGNAPKALPKTGILRLDARSTRAALKRQKDALDSVQFENCVRSELKHSILRPETCASIEVVPLDQWWFENLDPDKREAVQRALAAKDFFVVHGPPGTGKTTFITELVLQFLKKQPNGRVLPLTTAEFELLGYLVRNRGRVMSRDRIMDGTRGIDWEAYDRSIDVLISQLRQKLDDDPKQPTFIRTVRGIGYCFIGGDRG